MEVKIYENEEFEVINSDKTICVRRKSDGITRAFNSSNLFDEMLEQFVISIVAMTESVRAENSRLKQDLAKKKELQGEVKDANSN